MKDFKEKVCEPLTKAKATRGKVVQLNKQFKGIAGSILDKTSRRQYLNMMLDATVTEIEEKTRKRKDKSEVADKQL